MLPGSYSRWFLSMTRRSMEIEPRSTCESCAMLPGKPDLPPEGPFEPAVLCCTYHPNLAPHFVGGILARGSARGRELVRERLAKRVGVSPLGLVPSPEYAALYQELASQPGAFGRRAEIRCPFLHESRCSIWEERGIACASFHCKFERGAIGAGRWNLLTIAFHVIEREIARWLVPAMGLSIADCDALLHKADDAGLDARAWGAWRGREEDYFLEANARIATLSWDELVARIEPSTEAATGQKGVLTTLVESLREALARSDVQPLPERVRRGEGILYRLGKPGVTRLQSPHVFLDLLDVPEELAAAIAKLGEAEISALRIDDSLAQKLLDWQVLLAVESR